MSIEYTVIPTIADLIMAGDLVESWSQWVDLADDREAVRKAVVVETTLGKYMPLGQGDRLSIDSLYHLDFGELRSAVNMFVTQFEEEQQAYKPEYSLVVDAGSNLTATQVEQISRRWKEIGGFSYLMSSGPLRSKKEPLLLTRLACALASLCQGFILCWGEVPEGMPQGVWTPQEFKRISVERLAS